MKLKITTPVNSHYQEVWQRFDSQLFQALNPPFPPVKLLRFDGSQKGGEVHLELNFLLFKQAWTSLITEQAETEEEIYFVDEGVKLPFFLKQWRHRHRIVKSEKGSLIIDDITFKTPTLLTNWLMLPAMYLQFLYRKPVYKKYFAKKNEVSASS